MDVIVKPGFTRAAWAKLSRWRAFGLVFLVLTVMSSTVPAQTLDFPSQNLQRWNPGVALEELPIDRTFSDPARVQPFSLRPIFALGVTADVQFLAADGYVRVIFIDSDLNEYLAWEAYPLISPQQAFSVIKTCRETCVLPAVVPDSIRIEIEGAQLLLHSLAINAESTRRRVLTQSAVDDIKQAQETELIARLNQQIKSKGMNWIAGETSISKLSFEEKKLIFGGSGVPNLQGFEYYVGGIFDFAPGSESTQSPTESIYVDAFDWRNQHRADDPASPYFDGDPLGSGWITDVRNQGSCGSCWAFAAIGATEAVTNLYYNQHLDLDLSEQDVLSCSGAGTCRGGFAFVALDFIRDFGVVDEACFVYSATDEACSNKCAVPDESIRINGNAIDFSYDEDMYKQIVLERGPAAIGMFGNVPIPRHCVTLVGWGRDPVDSRTYWIFKNSWGQWGDNGYGYVKAGPGSIFRLASIFSPVTSSVADRYSVACVDRDNDGYFNWGLSELPPQHCGDIPPQKDCNDADPSASLRQSDGSCIPDRLEDLRRDTTIRIDVKTRVFTNDRLGCPADYRGKVLFDAVLNLRRPTRRLTYLSLEVRRISGDDLILLDNGELIGAGDSFPLPPVGDYADRVLEGEESVRLPVQVCVKNFNIKKGKKKKAASKRQRRWPRVSFGVKGISEYRYHYRPISYQWISPQGGESLTLSDDSFQQVDIGFDFKFYDGVYDKLYVASNGIVSFGQGASEFFNVPIPSESAPNNFIAPFWDDLRPGQSTSITVKRHRGGGKHGSKGGKGGNRRVTITWSNIPRYPGVGAASFQVTLHERTGYIDFAYRDVIFSELSGIIEFDRGSSATVGVEDASGKRGTLYSFNRSVIENLSSLRFFTDFGERSTPHSGGKKDRNVRQSMR